MDGFDFGFSPDGEIIVDTDTHDIYKSQEDELKIQLSYNRIKSISKNWFIDEVGADLEKIIDVLTFDGLWDDSDIFIKSEIKNNINITYNIFLKLRQSDTEEVYSYEIDAELDLVKGVHIRYGWEPRR